MPGNCQVGQVAAWDGSDWTCVDANLEFPIQNFVCEGLLGDLAFSVEFSGALDIAPWECMGGGEQSARFLGQGQVSLSITDVVLGGVSGNPPAGTTPGQVGRFAAFVENLTDFNTRIILVEASPLRVHRAEETGSGGGAGRIEISPVTVELQALSPQEAGKGANNTSDAKLWWDNFISGQDTIPRTLSYGNTYVAYDYAGCLPTRYDFGVSAATETLVLVCSLQQYSNSARHGFTPIVAQSLIEGPLSDSLRITILQADGTDVQENLFGKYALSGYMHTPIRINADPTGPVLQDSVFESASFEVEGLSITLSQ